MLPADAGTRTAPAPPITTILSEEPGLFENVLSWVRGEVPPTAVNPPDTAATAAAIEKGRETVRRNKAKVEKEAKVEGSSSSGVGRISMGLGEVVVAKEEETVAREMKAARAAAAAAELRVHATGLLSAGMFSRSLNDVAVHRGLAADLVSRLREGPVANHLRVEAARGRREQQRGTSLVVATTAASTATAAATAVQEEKTGNGTGGEEVSREESRPERQARPVRSGNGRGEGGTNAAPEALSGSEWGWGRWPSMAAAEAEHVTACVSGVGSYQEVGEQYTHARKQLGGKEGSRQQKPIMRACGGVVRYRLVSRIDLRIRRRTVSVVAVSFLLEGEKREVASANSLVVLSAIIICFRLFFLAGFRP